MAVDLDLLCINTIRTLAMDAVQAANSGHPGAPMGLAPVAYTLWQNFLRYDPEDPTWPNRDRFVLSNGHASMLLYSVLHLVGVKNVPFPRHSEKEQAPLPHSNGDARDGLAISLDDIKRFRQLGSRTPGHPEYRVAPGIETTTGPLGQGVATSVGMAAAARWLGAHFNRPGFDLFDFRVYAMCGDGDMMEGVASEAASIAGHLRLPNLCWIYDNNHISIEGDTALAYSEDVGARFQAYGWNVLRVADANDLPALHEALDTTTRPTDGPTFIVVDSHIAYGSPNKQDTGAAHGEPLGADEVKATKRVYGWPEDAQFLVPEGVREHFKAGVGERGHRMRTAWEAKLAEYHTAHPDLAGELDLLLGGEIPSGWDGDLPVFPADPKGIATRDSSGTVLNAIAKHVPWLLGGAADLAPSTKTRLTFDNADDLEAETPGGRNLHFGVREHGMSAFVNGMALTGLRPYGSTFLIFSDYAKPAIRLSSIMEISSTFVFTHDSIGLGEDGPTHQPIEQLASLRSIPGMIVLRPADANEVVEAWRVILQLRDQPASLVLTRQALPTIDRSTYAAATGLARGAYVLADSGNGTPEVLLLATGSEVSLCLSAYERLTADGVRARVVSFPSWELFEAQDQSYRDSVLPPDVHARVAVEMGSTFGWDRYVGPRGEVIGMRSFGASGPIKDVVPHFGFTVDHIVTSAQVLVARGRG